MIPGNSKGNSSLSTGGDWAAIASTPHNRGSRFAMLATDDDGDSADGQPFTVVDRRRSVKRARQRSSPSQTTTTQRPSQHRQKPPRSQQQQQPPTRRAPTVYGKASGSRGTNIAAAKITRKKAVFCLDNIAKTCSVDDVCVHVSRLSVQVLTCFEVKSRRRRDDTNDEDVSDRMAFRLCIYDDEREKLLDPDAWPNSVTISPWYFKSPGAREADILPRGRGSDDVAAAGDGAVTARSAAGRSPHPRSNTPDTVQSADAAAAATTAPSESLQDESVMSNDETILTPVNADNDGN